MQKVYLLLRNNSQSGPFTMEELLQQGLQPADLIWIEGKSQAWAHPSEMELHPSIDEVPVAPAAPKSVYVSTTFSTPHPEAAEKKEPGAPPQKRSGADPGAEEDIERKAEELKRSILAAAPPRYYDKPASRPPARGLHPVYPASEDEIPMTYRSRTTKLTGHHVVAGALVMTLLLAGWFKGWSPINQPKSERNVVAVPYDPGSGHNEVTAENPAEHTPPNTVVMEHTSEQANAAMAVTPLPAPEKPKGEEKPAAKLTTQMVAAAHAATEPAAHNQQSEKKDEVAGPPLAAAPQPKEEKKESVAAETKDTVEETPEKRKTLGQVLKGIFRKKAKAEEKDSSEGDSATQPGSGSR